MRFAVHPVVPQPVLADPKPPGRWIWRAELPIIDHQKVGGTYVGGNWTVSWWNDANEVVLLGDAHCDIDRPKGAKVPCLYDGERWVWHIASTERQHAAWVKARAPVS